MSEFQMYSMDDSSGSGVVTGGVGDDVRGPIYDTINEDSGSGSAYSGSRASGSVKGSGGYGAGGVNGGSSTFGTPHQVGYPPGGGGGGSRTNGGFSGHEYDVPEGQERQPASRSASSVGAVTINGIAV